MIFVLVGVTAPIGKAAEMDGFSDVPDSAWFAEAIRWCIENDIMSGITETSFAPGEAMTRVSIAEALYRAAGRPALTHPTLFSDVNTSASYSNAVSWETSKGIITGYGNSLFGPDDKITRAQVAQMLKNFI